MHLGERESVQNPDCCCMRDEPTAATRHMDCHAWNVFLTVPQASQNARTRRVTELVTRLQAVVRGRLARQAYQRQRVAALRIQVSRVSCTLLQDKHLEGRRGCSQHPNLCPQTASMTRLVMKYDKDKDDQSKAQCQQLGARLGSNQSPTATSKDMHSHNVQCGCAHLCSLRPCSVFAAAFVPSMANAHRTVAIPR